VTDLRVGPEEFNRGRKRIAIGTKALANAAAVQRLPRSSNKLPPDTVGHEELPSIRRPPLTCLPII
jgi:hypothetical protein